MKRTWLLLGVVCFLALNSSLAVAEEPTTAARLPGPTFLTSFSPQYSLTEPPQVEGLLTSPSCSGSSRCPSSPQMIGGASVGMYRMAGNENVLPVSRMFGTFTTLPTTNVLPHGK